MIFDTAEFVFHPSPVVRRARRILIKPCAAYPLPPPVTTSREILATVIEGIRRVSDADIIFLEGSCSPEPMSSLYRLLGYDFPRVHLLDVNKCTLVEVENPLPHSFALPTVWMPNIILTCDYLISIAPFKVIGGKGNFTISNLLSLLPPGKYKGQSLESIEALQQLGFDNIVADLYFTIPFDLGIIDAGFRFTSESSPVEGEVEEYGKILIGEPYKVDSEASEVAGVETKYIRLIRMAKGEAGS